jgi:hypothetical protein
MSRITRGPWAIRKDSVTEIMSADGDVVARVIGAREEFVANAQAIAALPDLLDALSQMVEDFKASECNCDGEYVDGGVVGSACYFHRNEEQIKAALKKAGIE